MKVRRTLILAAVTAAALAGAAVPAGAITVYSSPPAGVTYNCTFPGVPQQPLLATETFSGPDTVGQGTVFAITGISGTLTLSAAVHALLTAVGYDGVRGTGFVPVTAANATPGATGTGSVPPTIWTSTSATIPFTGGSQSFVAGTPGVITFSTGTSFTWPLELHKKSTGTWTAWSMACTVKVTSPPQNRAFTPTLPVT
jgi:hypothetical protein